MVIKVGFIGLGPGGWARGAHLPYLQKGGEYEIVAVCNTSVDSARRAIELYGLKAATKAYGSPEDIAKDPDVELIICSVRVDRHLSALTPALKAGKDVVVEWPLGRSAAEARELLRLKNEGNVKRAEVSLQARQAPVIHVLKNLVSDGAIGKVLSSTWVSCALGGGPSTTQRSRYLGDKEVGGNLVTIHLAHALDYVQNVLGYGVTSPHALFRRRRERITLLNDDGTLNSKNVEKTADDVMYVTGELGKDKIPTSWNLMGGPAFPGTSGMEWKIYGLTGIIRVSAPGPFLQIGYHETKIELLDLDSGSVKEIEVPKDDIDEWPVADFPYNPGFKDFAFQNMARMYRHLAKGGSNCTWEDAVERHNLIEELYRQNGYTEV